MTTVTTAWCPTCEEYTVLEPGRPCAWCDTIVVSKRGGWKRPDARARSKISTGQARAIHAAHMRGLSLQTIAKDVYEKLGYASAGSCLEGIRYAFDREGLAARGRIAATVAANRARRQKMLPGEDKLAYKRRMRRERGYRDGRTGEWRIAS